MSRSPPDFTLRTLKVSYSKRGVRLGIRVSPYAYWVVLGIKVFENIIYS